MMRQYLWLWCVVCLFLGFACHLEANVVINEIMYHPPNDLETLEYIELHNFGDTPVNISGWAFTNGVKYTFPDGTHIAEHGYLVVCRDMDLFRETYGTDIVAVGNFEGALNNSGERVTLSDADGKAVDTVKYEDTSPWPVSADGYSASLEKITPSQPSDAFNWAGATLPKDAREPMGTPGQPNASFSPNLPPILSEAEFSPDQPLPNQPIAVRIAVTDDDGLAEVSLLYRTATSGDEGEEQAIPMKPVSGGETASLYEAALPGQPDNRLVRFRVRALDRLGNIRFEPSQTSLRPAFSVFVCGKQEQTTIPIAFVVHTDAEMSEEAAEIRARNRRESQQGGPEQWQAENMLRQGMNIEAAWFHLTGTQTLTPEQMQQLRPVYRNHFDTREEQIGGALELANLRDAMQGFPEKIRTFNTGLLDATQEVLTAEQQQEFVRWHQQSMMSAMEGFQWGAEQAIKRFVNLERAFFYQTVMLSLDDAQYAKLREIYLTTAQERHDFIEAVRPFENDEEKLNEFFGQVVALNRALPEKSKDMLTPEQYKAFNRWYEEELMFRNRFESPKPPEPPRGQSAFVYISPDGSQRHVYDFISVTPRSGGYKARFHKDQPLQFAGAELTTVNLLYEYMPRFALAEHLAYEVYRRADVPTPLSGYLRLAIDGDLVGYHLVVEQPNRAFLRRNERDDDGNLYKILWYEQGVVDQHEKKTNAHTGHDDIVNLIEALNQTTGDAQWELIQRHFNVDELASYFAVNMCLSNWDGFFNNYFTYHDVDDSGRWEIYPWDEDKTWGFYDGIAPGAFFYDMPLTFGMNGDIPPGLDSVPEGGVMAWQREDVPNWWRGPGYFSGPLLANSQFRTRFLQRLKEIVETIYTEAVFEPVIDDLAARLTPEVAIRAKANDQNVDEAQATFLQDIQALRQHLTKRRDFILAQQELQDLK